MWIAKPFDYGTQVVEILLIFNFSEHVLLAARRRQSAAYVLAQYFIYWFSPQSGLTNGPPHTAGGRLSC